jgi:two-component system, OmpR family, phosphate regulon sensor histidine kinase PhoR
MKLRLTIRTLSFGVIAGALLLCVMLASRFMRSVLASSLAGRLPADDVAGIMADVSEVFLAVLLVALGLALVASLVLGSVLARSLDQIRQDIRLRLRGGDRPVAEPAIAEIRTLARAVDLLIREEADRATRLTQERDEFALLLSSVSEGILQIGPDSRIIHANPAARSMLGMPAEVRGLPVGTLVRSAELRPVLEQASAGQMQGSFDISLEDRRLLVSAQPMPDPAGGDAGGVVVAFADLTELRRLEGVRRDFVANASHELKTPLTSIRGYVETLITDDLPAETQRHFLEVVHRNAERLQQIVDDLLDLSRLESGGWRPDLQPTDVRALAASTWTGFADRARRAGIVFEITGKAVHATVDAGGLQQVLSNLYDNALRYTPEGGRVQVTISGAQGGPAVGAGGDGLTISSGESVLIDVQDTGMGIPSDALPRIFERFYRVDPARSRAEGGTGLGLSIVRHLMERMGGAVSAESELGRGTTIRLRLPVAA